MGFNVSFNARTVEPNLPPAPVPTGEYTVIIVSTDEKPTKNGGGQTFYEIVMQIVDGEFKGRRVTDRLNCKNKNEQAREIAYATLSSICWVTGVIQLQNSSAELHGKPFKVSVAKVARDDDPTKDGNEIRGYYDISGRDPGEIKNAMQGGGSAGGSAGASSGFGDEEKAPDFGGGSSFGGDDAGSSFGGSNDGATGGDAGDGDDPPERVIELMVEGMEYEAALAKYQAEVAAAKAPKETPQQIAARKAAEAARAKAAAAASTKGNAGASQGGGGVPDWAQE